MSAPSVKWATLESEVRGLLVLTVRSKGCLPHATACALNVLAQPSVVQKYKLRGNRWTEPNNAALDAVDGAAGSVEDEDAPLLDHETLRVLQLAKEQFSDAMSQRSTAEWLQALGAAMDEPMADRPWFHSGELRPCCAPLPTSAAHRLGAHARCRALTPPPPPPPPAAAPFRHGMRTRARARRRRRVDCRRRRVHAAALPHLCLE